MTFFESWYWPIKHKSFKKMHLWILGPGFSTALLETRESSNTDNNYANLLRTRVENYVMIYFGSFWFIQGHYGSLDSLWVIMAHSAVYHCREFEPRVTQVNRFASHITDHYIADPSHEGLVILMFEISVHRFFHSQNIALYLFAN